MTEEYSLVIHWSTEDNAFIAEVPELAGCMADGRTYSEVMRNVEVVIAEWIETAQLRRCFSSSTQKSRVSMILQDER